MGNSYLSMHITTLSGRFSKDKFIFDCGFEVPASQIYCLVPGYSPSIGDGLSFEISNFKFNKHKHKFSCACGEVHNDE